MIEDEPEEGTIDPKGGTSKGRVDLSVSKKDIMERLLGHPIIQVLEEKGITAEFLADKLKEEMEAKETKFFAHQGEVIDERDTIDWAVRQKARMDAHRLMGHYPPEKPGDTYLGLFLQQNNLVLSPVVKQVLEQHSKGLLEYIKKDDFVEGEIQEDV
jgi:hypothetical protein